MTTTKVIKDHVVQKFGFTPIEADPFDGESVEAALGEIERLIKWLGYVSDHEFTDTERARITSKARSLAKTLQPIASKISRLGNYPLTESEEEG